MFGANHQRALRQKKNRARRLAEQKARAERLAQEGPPPAIDPKNHKAPQDNIDDPPESDIDIDGPRLEDACSVWSMSPLTEKITQKDGTEKNKITQIRYVILDNQFKEPEAQQITLDKTKFIPILSSAETFKGELATFMFPKGQMSQSHKEEKGCLVPWEAVQARAWGDTSLTMAPLRKDIYGCLSSAGQPVGFSMDEVAKISNIKDQTKAVTMIRDMVTHSQELTKAWDAQRLAKEGWSIVKLTEGSREEKSLTFVMRKTPSIHSPLTTVKDNHPTPCFYIRVHPEYAIKLRDQHDVFSCAAPIRDEIYIEQGLFETLSAGTYKWTDYDHRIPYRNLVGQLRWLVIRDSRYQGKDKWADIYKSSLEPASRGRPPRYRNPHRLELLILVDESCGVPTKSLQDEYQRLRTVQNPDLTHVNQEAIFCNKISKEAQDKREVFSFKLATSPFGHYDTFIKPAHMVDFLTTYQPYRLPPLDKVKQMQSVYQAASAQQSGKNANIVQIRHAALVKHLGAAFPNRQVDAVTRTSVLAADRLKRTPAQNDVMGTGAKDIAKVLDWPNLDDWVPSSGNTNKENKPYWNGPGHRPSEWLHRQAYSWGTTLSGPGALQAKDNLIFGCGEANSFMIRYEKAYQFLIGIRQLIDPKAATEVMGTLETHINDPVTPIYETYVEKGELAVARHRRVVKNNTVHVETAVTRCEHVNAAYVWSKPTIQNTSPDLWSNSGPFAFVMDYKFSLIDDGLDLGLDLQQTRFGTTFLPFQRTFWTYLEAELDLFIEKEMVKTAQSKLSMDRGGQKPPAVLAFWDSLECPDKMTVASSDLRLFGKDSKRYDLGEAIVWIPKQNQLQSLLPKLVSGLDVKALYYMWKPQTGAGVKKGLWLKCKYILDGHGPNFMPLQVILDMGFRAAKTDAVTAKAFVSTQQDLNNVPDPSAMELKGKLMGNQVILGKAILTDHFLTIAHHKVWDDLPPYHDSVTISTRIEGNAKVNFTDNRDTLFAYTLDPADGGSTLLLFNDEPSAGDLGCDLQIWNLRLSTVLTPELVKNFKSKPKVEFGISAEVDIKGHTTYLEGYMDDSSWQLAGALNATFSWADILLLEEDLFARKVKAEGYVFSEGFIEISDTGLRVIGTLSVPGKQATGPKSHIYYEAQIELSANGIHITDSNKKVIADLSQAI